MSAWTKEKKLDTLIELITWDHWPIVFDTWPNDVLPSSVLRCKCGNTEYWPDHLRQMIANEGLVDDDPGVR